MARATKRTSTATRKPTSTKAQTLEPVRARDVKRGDVLEHFGKVTHVIEPNAKDRHVRLLLVGGAHLKVQAARFLARVVRP